MIGIRRVRGPWILAVLSAAWLLAPGTPGRAQFRPGSQRDVDRPAPEAVNQGITPEQAAETIASFAEGQAPAGEPSPFAVTGTPRFIGTNDRQIRRYRGDNNEFNFEVGPSGRNIGGNPLIPSMGFTIDKVHEGYYMPGFGVNLGFPAPERVRGGFYTPGWGVMGGVGDFNNPTPYQSVQGGQYIPGFGVGGGPAVIGNMGGPAVIGNMSGAVVGGFSPVTSGSSVVGGSYTPGFGVTGGR